MVKFPYRNKYKGLIKASLANNTLLALYRIEPNLKSLVSVFVLPRAKNFKLLQIKMNFGLNKTLTHTIKHENKILVSFYYLSHWIKYDFSLYLTYKYASPGLIGLRVKEKPLNNDMAKAILSWFFCGWIDLINSQPILDKKNIKLFNLFCLIS